jgi:hypothetical protein
VKIDRKKFWYIGLPIEFRQTARGMDVGVEVAVRIEAQGPARWTGGPVLNHDEEAVSRTSRH